MKISRVELPRWWLSMTVQAECEIENIGRWTNVAIAENINKVNFIGFLLIFISTRFFKNHRCIAPLYRKGISKK